MYRYFRNISEDGCLNQKAKYEIHKKPFLTIDQNHENFKTNDRVKILFSENSIHIKTLLKERE